MNIIIVIGLLFIILALRILIRNERVYRLIIELLDEEDIWLRLKIEREHYLGKLFLRQKALPSYDRMLWQLWKPIEDYRKELEPIADYYGGER